MNKQDRIQKLIKECKELSDLNSTQKSKTKDLQELARMSRWGLRGTVEYNILEQKTKQNTVIDFTDIINRISNTVKYL